MMVQKELEFQAKHNYYLSRSPTGKEHSLWLVFHGYGQLAQFFLRKFTFLFREDCLIAAPEGLNHFYLEGFSGRVGANWMTKHEREVDIANNISYLNQMMDELLRQLPHVRKINTLGFSQGAATMSRWVCQTAVKPAKVVFWGGAPAHDLNPTLLADALKDSLVLLAKGENDPFLQSENYSAQQALLDKAGLVNFKELGYAGGHELEAGLLEEIFLM
jgi:predicted esterase